MTKVDKQNVVISGIDIPFFDMVILLVQIAIAAIPAAIFLTIIGFIIAELFAQLGLSM